MVPALVMPPPALVEPKLATLLIAMPMPKFSPEIVAPALLTMAPETLPVLLIKMPSIAPVIFCVLVMPPWSAVTLPTKMP